MKPLIEPARIGATRGGEPARTGSRQGRSSSFLRRSGGGGLFRGRMLLGLSVCLLAALPATEIVAVESVDGPAAAGRSAASVKATRVVQAGGAPGAAADVRRVGFQHPAPGHVCRGECRGVGCPTHCPVRPQTFGFYRTQWRAWPTDTVAAGGDSRASIPVPAPASAVPGIDEESLRPSDEESAGREPPSPDGIELPQPEVTPATEPGREAVREADREADRDAEPGTARPMPRGDVGDLPILEPQPADSPAERESPKAPPDEELPDGRANGIPDLPDPATAPAEGGDATPDTEAEAAEQLEDQPEGKRQDSTDDNIFDEADRARRRSEMLAMMRNRVVAPPARAVELATVTIDLPPAASHPAVSEAGDERPDVRSDDPPPVQRGLRGSRPTRGGGNPLRPARGGE